MTELTDTGNADVIFFNGDFIALDSDDRRHQALAVKDGRIVGLGTDDELKAFVGIRTMKFDLKGRIAVPGLIDTHTHVELSSYAEHLWLDARGISKIDLVQRITEEVSSRAENEWIIFQGTFGQEVPSRSELDQLAPKNPVVVRWSAHKAQVNTAALEASGITKNTVVPPGMRIRRDEKGEFHGILEEAWDLLAWRPPGAEELAPVLEKTARDLYLRHGITTIQEVVGSPGGLVAWQLLAEKRTIPRMGLSLTATPGHQPMIDAKTFGGIGLSTGFGNDRCWLQAVKIFMDGGRDGAFREDLGEKPASEWGLLTRTPQQLVAEIDRAARSRLQVWIHAIGYLAQESAISAIEQLQILHPELDHRTRIEHFGNEWYGSESLLRLHKAGGIAVPNPTFVSTEPDDASKRVPQGIEKYPFRKILDLTGILPGNSDTAGTQPFAANPWFGMKCLTTLRNRSGIKLSEGNTIGTLEALKAYTNHAAYATFQEHDKGSLELGKLCDFAVLDRDPLLEAPDNLDKVVTLATVIGGEVVFGDIP